MISVANSSYQENYFGEDDMYTDFEEVISSPVLSMSTSSSSGWTAVGVDTDKKDSDATLRPVHPLTLRPWDITVLVNVYKVHGRLPVVRFWLLYSHASGVQLCQIIYM